MATYAGIANFNEERRDEVAEALIEIRDEINKQIGLLDDLIRSEWPSEHGHAEAYVINHLKASCDGVTKYDSCIQSMIDELQCEEMRGNAEPIAEFGESWEEDDEDDDIGTCGSCGHRGTIGAACWSCGGRGVYESDE